MPYKIQNTDKRDKGSIYKRHGLKIINCNPGIDIKEIEVEGEIFKTNGNISIYTIKGEKYRVIKSIPEKYGDKRKFLIVEKNKKKIKYIPIERHPNPEIANYFGVNQDLTFLGLMDSIENIEPTNKKLGKLERINSEEDFSDLEEEILEKINQNL